MVELLDGQSFDWWKEKSKKWTAGSNLDEAVNTVKNFNEKGFRVVINSIAAKADDPESVEKTCNNYISLIETIKKNNLNAGITVRTTNLGIGFSFEGAKKAVKMVLDKAKENNVPIEIDTEERNSVENTYKLDSELIEEGYSFRVCVQSGIKDITDQVESLLKKGQGRLSFRIVTGSCYKETLEVDEPETVKQFYKIMKLCGKGSAIGTHITERILCANALGLETQVLMGFEDEQPEKSVSTVYACFGDWQTNEGIRGYIKRREGTE